MFSDSTNLKQNQSIIQPFNLGDDCIDNQLTVMCTTRGERRLIRIRCQKECVESILNGQTDSHSDYRSKLQYQVFKILLLLMISICIFFNLK